jgi:hypothetical protein
MKELIEFLSKIINAIKNSSQQQFIHGFDDSYDSDKSEERGQDISNKLQF